MRALHVSPCKIGGTLTLPPSKSQTIRALTFALLARGTSRIENPLDSPDIDAMVRGIEGLGAKVHREADGYSVTGGFNVRAHAFDVGNSGLAFRFLAALASLGESPVVIDGDHSIRTRRPITPLLGALEQLGARAHRLPSGAVEVCGPWQGNFAAVDGSDSQPVSALLIAGVLRKRLEIEIKNPGEAPWVALTLEWLTRLGIQWRQEERLIVEGGAIEPFSYRVPSDMSSLAFPFVAAKLSGQRLDFGAIDRAQGDAVLIDWLSGEIGGTIDVNEAIDAIPILAVAGCFGRQTLTLHNGAIARKKECDRIAVMCRELKKMGARIEERADGLVIHPSQLHGTQLECASDHRVALALSVAAMHAQGSSVIAGAECIDKTFKGYVETMNEVGGKLQWA